MGEEAQVRGAAASWTFGTQCHNVPRDRFAPGRDHRRTACNQQTTGTRRGLSAAWHMGWMCQQRWRVRRSPWPPEFVGDEPWPLPGDPPRSAHRALRGLPPRSLRSLVGLTPSSLRSSVVLRELRSGSSASFRAHACFPPTELMTGVAPSGVQGLGSSLGGVGRGMAPPHTAPNGVTPACKTWLAGTPVRSPPWALPYARVVARLRFAGAPGSSLPGKRTPSFVLHHMRDAAHSSPPARRGQRLPRWTRPRPAVLRCSGQLHPSTTPSSHR